MFGMLFSPFCQTSSWPTRIRRQLRFNLNDKFGATGRYVGWQIQNDLSIVINFRRYAKSDHVRVPGKQYCVPPRADEFIDTSRLVVRRFIEC